MRGSSSKSPLRSAVRTRKSHPRDKEVVPRANLSNSSPISRVCETGAQMVVSHTRNEPTSIEAQEPGPTKAPPQMRVPASRKSIQDPPERWVPLRKPRARADLQLSLALVSAASPQAWMRLTHGSELVS